MKQMNNYPVVSHSSERVDQNIQILRLFPRPFTHQHIYFELVYVLQGSATRKMTDAKIPVSAGDYYVSDPLSAHGYEDIQDFEIISCLFLPESCDTALKGCPSISGLLSNQILRFGVAVDMPIADRVLHDTDGSVKRLFKNMEREYVNRGTGYVEMIRCYLIQALVCAVRDCEEISSINATTTVMNHLKEHYAEPLSLHTLSQLAGYTPQYLSSLFSHDVGISMQEYLQRLRIDEACKLLTNTGLSTAEISAAVGYQDTRHFAKLFRRYQGISPRDYRKNNNIIK